MDDFFDRMPFHCFDVALKQQFLAENFDPNNVTKLLKAEDDMLKWSIGKILPSGTCFVFCKPRGIIRIGNKRVIAFGLTNFHVAYNLVTKEKNKDMFVTFDTDIDSCDDSDSDNIVRSFSCSPIIEFQSKLRSVQISNHSKPYCLPNDVSVLAIYQFNPFTRPRVPAFELCLDFTVLPIAERAEIRNYELKNVLISGYPTGSRDINYMLPESIDIIDAKTKIKEGFHNFNSQVISEGIFRLSDSGLAELELSSTSGMSGSPIMTGSSLGSKVRGIYCGGPPLNGQAELIQMVRSLISRDYEKAYKIFLSLPFEDPNCYSIIEAYHWFKVLVLEVFYLVSPEEIKESIDNNYPEIKNIVIKKKYSEKSVDHIVELIGNSTESLLLNTVREYQEKEIFFYNSGISAECDVFDYIRDIKSLLETFTMYFDSELNLEDYLLNYFNLTK